MLTGAEYRESLRALDTEIHFMGERVKEPVDHPAILPHINSAAVTYDLAFDPEHAELGRAVSHVTGHEINRFTHVPQSQDDLVKKIKMLRVAGQLTGSCFQRCVGLDAMSALDSVTYDVDAAQGTDYHQRFRAFLAATQDADLMSGGAITDPKGDRSKRPGEQDDPDMFVRVVERRADGVVIRGAKMHQTGAVNSHQFILLPGQALAPDETDYAIACAVPADAPGVIQVFGRHANDSRKWEGRTDQGNPSYGSVGGEALVIFDDVFVPTDHVFLDGETEFAVSLIDRFSSYHRANYGGCKSGVLDVLIGATHSLAEVQGTARASHIRSKLAEMAHLSESLYAGALACSYECSALACGTAMVDPLLANTTKLNVPANYAVATQRAMEIAGGVIATLPSEQDLDNPRVAPFIRKYVQTREDEPAEDRIRLARLIENMTAGTPLVECMHGAGSPEVQRVLIARNFDWGERQRLARRIIADPAGVFSPTAPQVSPNGDDLHHEINEDRLTNDLD